MKSRKDKKEAKLELTIGEDHIECLKINQLEQITDERSSESLIYTVYRRFYRMQKKQADKGKWLEPMIY